MVKELSAYVFLMKYWWILMRWVKGVILLFYRLTGVTAHQGSSVTEYFCQFFMPFAGMEIISPQIRGKIWNFRTPVRELSILIFFSLYDQPQGMFDWLTDCTT